MKRRRPRTEEAELRRLYRQLLKRPRLSAAAIDRMHTNVRLLAQAICEHAWGKKAI